MLLYLFETDMLSQAQACANALILMSTDMYLGVTQIIKTEV